MLLISCPASRIRLREWICTVVLRDWLGQDFLLEPDPHRQDWKLSLAGASGELHMPDLLFALDDDQWLTTSSLPQLPLGQWPLPTELALPGLPRELPVLYGGLLEDYSWLRVDQLTTDTPAGSGLSARLGADLLGGIAFTLSRYAEYVGGELDQLGRYLPGSSLLGQAGLLERPIANEYAELLWKLMLGLWPDLRRPVRSFRLVPTHDVDNPLALPGRSRLQVAGDCLADLFERLDPTLAQRRWQGQKHVAAGELDHDPNNSFDWISEQSASRGLRSTFYFLVDDGRYQLEQPWIASLWCKLAERGHGIGLHPPAGTWNDQIRLAEIAERFRSALSSAGLAELALGPLSARQHLFQWQAPDTWRAYAAAGISTSSSCYFPQHAGFRTGSCWSFQPCDLRSGEALPIREEPPVVMEVSLLSRRYAGLSLQRAAQQMLRLGEVCKAVAGNFIVLWHNDRLISRGQQAAYSSVLDGLLEADQGSGTGAG